MYSRPGFVCAFAHPQTQAKAVSDPLSKPLSLLCSGLEDVAKYTTGLPSGAWRGARGVACVHVSASPREQKGALAGFQTAPGFDATTHQF
jgi:hypothetical protein